MKLHFARLLAAASGAFALACSTAHAELTPYASYMISWTPPTQNADGSELTELLGYYVYAGFSPDALMPIYFTTAATPRIQLYSAGLVRYFAVASVNADGDVSELSAVVSDASSQ